MGVASMSKTVGLIPKKASPPKQEPPKQEPPKQENNQK